MCSTTQQECLAKVLSVLLLPPYHAGKMISIRTDHDSTKRFLSLTNSTFRFARWSLILSESEVDIVHRAGVKHKATDVLSWLSTRDEDKTFLDEARSYLQLKCQTVCDSIVSNMTRPRTVIFSKKRNTTFQITRRQAKTRLLLRTRPIHTVALHRYTLIPRSRNSTLANVVYFSGSHPPTSQYRSWSRCIGK